MTEITSKTTEAGNNESMVRGVWKTEAGQFLAVTFSQSREFQSEKGAMKWFQKMTAK